MNTFLGRTELPDEIYVVFHECEYDPHYPEMTYPDEWRHCTLNAAKEYLEQGEDIRPSRIAKIVLINKEDYT